MKNPTDITLAELEAHFPVIPWRKPVRLYVLGTEKGWACRVCIARLGFSARRGELDELFEEVDEFEQHFRTHLEDE